jgi:hypothetical protein
MVRASQRVMTRLITESALACARVRVFIFWIFVIVCRYMKMESLFDFIGRLRKYAVLEIEEENGTSYWENNRRWD